MKMTMKVRVLTLVATIALLGGTAFVASGSTGAYFSDSVNGAISGSTGTILITPNTTAVSFSDLLPGVPQTVTVNYQNTGNSTEDVYLDFNDVSSLSALNNLGHYGEVTISSSGDGNQGTEFFSSNLDDLVGPGTECGTASNAQSTVTTAGESGPGMLCWPLTTNYLLTKSLTPGDSGSFSFTFEYAPALGGSPTVSAPWNTYPVAGQTYPGTTSGTGLPFTLVATQPGITPGQVGYKF